tara:strand:+ start:566 stop:892 length:327 start_codon:yes stop_codon:yes gene_type:complete
MLDLEIVKQWCRIEIDESDDDATLEMLSNAAQRIFEHETGRHLYATNEAIPKDPATGQAVDDRALVLDDDIALALSLLISAYYDNRDGNFQIHPAMKMAMKPYQFYNV